MRRRLRCLWADRPAFVVLSAVTLGILLVWPAVDVSLRQAGVGIPFGFNDWGAYAGAVNRWSEGSTIYVQNERGGYHGTYLYPPITLLVFSPFATFDFYTGAVMFGGVSLVLLWLGFDAVASVLGYDLGYGERGLLLVALFGFHPALRAFKWGQVPTLLVALLCFAFYLQERQTAGDESGRWTGYVSGALTTVASAFKLFVATSGAHLLRDRRRFVGAMVTAGTLLVGSVAIFGVDTHLRYLDVLLWGKGWGEARPPHLWDTSAAYHPLYVVGSLGLAIRGLGLLGVIGLVVATRGDEAPAVRQAVFALGVAGVPLFAPSADTHDLVFLLLPAVILVAGELERPDGRPSLPVLAVLLVHLHRYGLEFAINPPDWLPLGDALPGLAPWLQPGAWGTLLLVGLAGYRVAEHRFGPVRSGTPSPGET